ncbi:conserved exported hypothetical protein [Flavobacterium sp. 9AF]|uniref:DM13 domain-containing protein n=1 Tax=Flavobacterium sp. 9AF TaxID=2653142 RepID=UPI0012F2A45F|nr:DM13 domain-containing protein [Flavobacterium sp. 9AF]VXA93271.1 conserved exported hypothetical protein [Flavobacterium sp. 9AF]
MKKVIYFSLFLFVVHTSSAQCNQFAFGFGNNNSTPMYNVQGTVEVILNTNNTITLTTGANFSTAAGPDVRVFLVDRGSLTNSQLKNTAMFLSRPKIEMGMLPSTGSTVTGNRTFAKTIPSNVIISNFNTVYFYCQAFNQFWDFGSFTPFSTSNCNFLDAATFKNNDFNVYPNPVNTVLKIKDYSTEIKEVSIYNSLGQLVLHKTTNFEEINMEQLFGGLYSLQVTDLNGNQYFKNVLKE